MKKAKSAAIMMAPLTPLLMSPRTMRKSPRPPTSAVEILVFGLSVEGGVFGAGGSDEWFKRFPQG